MKIGLLLQRSGPAGLWSASAEACALLAAAEINAAGGILGRPIELTIADPGTTSREAHAQARALVEIEEVEAVVGMHPSTVRAAVVAATTGRVPFVYTPQYEGGETTPGVYAIGETAEELLAAGVTWLSEHRKASRFFFVGSEYVWPRVSLGVARRVVRALGGSVVGERFVPLDTEDFDAVLTAIGRADPQVVILFLLGDDAVRFNRAFAERGFQARFLRLAEATDETMLYGIGDAAAENFFVASAYFSTVRSAANGSFLERYHSGFDGMVPPANAFGESCYEGLHFLAALAEEAGSMRTLAHGKARPTAFRTARATRAMTRLEHQRTVHFATADGLDFSIVASLEAR